MKSTKIKHEIIRKIRNCYGGNVANFVVCPLLLRSCSNAVIVAALNVRKSWLWRAHWRGVYCVAEGQGCVGVSEECPCINASTCTKPELGPNWNQKRRWMWKQKQNYPASLLLPEIMTETLQSMYKAPNVKLCTEIDMFVCVLFTDVSSFMLWRL